MDFNKSEPPPPTGPVPRSVAVYLHRTGEVVHMHHASAEDPWELPADDELRRLAIEIASRLLNLDPTDLKAIGVKADTDARGKTYRVDVKSGELIATGTTPKSLLGLREPGCAEGS